MNAPQIRAARAILDWSQEELAAKTDLSITTIRKIESGHISPRDSTNDKIRDVFELAGLEFMDGNGVRERSHDITIYEGEDGARKFQDDVYHTGIQHGGEIVQVWSMEMRRKFIQFLGSHRQSHIDRMMIVQNIIRIKCILTEDQHHMNSPIIEYRYLPRSYVDCVPFYVYGNKFAVFDILANKEGRMIVVQSKAIADTYRLQFKSMWEKATPLINPNSALLDKG
ncbi:MAG: helix-turn-helix domain-containing protein [Alphaproteobacteria bacterium]|nr:helix-turn-helix domain-containing protein [Alphaproteobacteria bacterium]MBV8548493.1 helix-turn-helix domain-containing protein [Alphaproteobacteria bacterium]